MRTPSVCRSIVVAVAVIAVLAVPEGSPAGARTALGLTNCGDMAGPVWHVIVPGEKKGATGSHYTVEASNMSCAKARVLTARMIRLPAPARGLNMKVLPGYTCMNPLYTYGLPGLRFFAGTCFTGNAPMPVPGASAFNWHHCEFVPGNATHRTQHPTCAWKYYYVP